MTLIDVNGSSSYKAGHIPGAIDFATVKKELAAKLKISEPALYKKLKEHGLGGRGTA